MFNANTERLLDYWRGRRDGRPAPRRADIDPAGFPRLAPHAFIVAQDTEGDIRFRLAGEAVAGLHGRPLGGESVLPLWRTQHRARLLRLLASAMASAEPLVIEAECETSACAAPQLEVLFAPLEGGDGDRDRFLGLYQPLQPGLATPIGPLGIMAVNGLAEAARRAHLRLASLDGRRIA
jgi:hypothetical protein